MAEEHHLDDYLAGEIESRERTFRISAALYVVLALIVVGYFVWLKSAAAEILDEERLATFVVEVGEQTFQANEGEIVEVFRSTVPRMARDALRETVESTLPAIRTSGEELFERYARELAGAGSSAATTAFEQILKDHKAELLSLSGAPPGRFTHRPPTLHHLSALIDREASKTLNDRPEETVGAKLAASTHALQAIHQRLNALAKGAGSRQDILTRRLLSTWWTMLQSTDHETAVEKVSGLQPMLPENLGSGDSDL